MNELNTSFANCQAVVNNCNTPEQHESARKYCTYFLSTIKRAVNVSEFERQQFTLKTQQLIDVCSKREPVTA